MVLEQASKPLAADHIMGPQVLGANRRLCVNAELPEVPGHHGIDDDAFTDAAVMRIPIQPATPNPVNMENSIMSRVASVPKTERSESPVTTIRVRNISGYKVTISS